MSEIIELLKPKCGDCRPMQLQKEKCTCDWKEEKGVDYYYTCGCIGKWYKQEDKTDWKYCPYCGRKIKVVEK